MLKEENVVIADKKVADDRAYYILVDKTAIPENKEISIDCPKEVRGKFIGKNGKGVVAMIQRLARKGVIVRRVHFIEEDTDA
jgi:predicted RNA-binding protein YlqC (UPF0109 family)